MKTLLLHPEDSPRRGPWTTQKWDRIVDLGTSPESVASAWRKQTGSDIVRLGAFRQSVEDPRQAGHLLQQFFGTLLDRHGLDWWELTCLAAHSSLETLIALRRLVREVPLEGGVQATRAAWPVSGLIQLLNRPVPSFASVSDQGLGANLRRWWRAAARLSPSQMADVFWDKYDSAYRWRAGLAAARRPSAEPVVLLPSAYTNVSRAAAAYARLLPGERFLLVATRDSGVRFAPPENVEIARLAQYAHEPGDVTEYGALEDGWRHLQARLAEIPEMAVLKECGRLQSISGLIRSGLAVRDAWIHVFEREPVSAVLCGDDSNWYTRIPVLLARMRNLPTLDFHHGAFDGRFLLKRLSSDLYLAKNEMEKDYLVRVCGLSAERVMVGGASQPAPVARVSSPGSRRTIVFFSEAFENLSARPEEIYRELLPLLNKLAQQRGRRLLIKLHPFENRAERSRLVEAALGAAAKRNVEIVNGPMTPGLLASAWFGIAVESSAVVDCARQGIPCFHCGWLACTPFGYAEQYARFGVGRLLQSLDEVLEIPRILETQDFKMPQDLDSPIATEILKKWLARQDSRVLSESH